MYGSTWLGLYSAYLISSQVLGLGCYRDLSLINDDINTVNISVILFSPCHSTSHCILTFRHELASGPFEDPCNLSFVTSNSYPPLDSLHV
ncbi:uncharacterized protein B0J16DRAFT_347519 [Fusarium flagelliforme]|uniref:uncharacterized protein n=1 Tax=Fusarium flagelliforme TaxID=2675880 RepID=UPI001E8CD839|nr:uncharacterized protein B0J16DRAFT_347519 [Fusarium flagelliforme]KAH7179704.1 hypothetical protein B0J16DRAFT_347519 [Fusarium flagelliforme]